IHLERVRSLVVLAVPTGERRRCLGIVRALPSSILVGEEDGLLVALTSDADGPSTAEAIRQQLTRRRATRVLAVAGHRISGVEDVPTSFEAARRCAGLLERMGREDGVIDVRAFAPYLSMFGARS